MVTLRQKNNSMLYGIERKREMYMKLDNIKDELYIYINDAISEYIGKYNLMLGDISKELDKKYSEGYSIIAESVFRQLKENKVV
tara:strand:+ start:41 stop:292 length:252 start_codon:yes stop_codon:yes gene_type:complete